MVSIRRNDLPRVVDGGRVTAVERRALRRPGRTRDRLVRELIARGVPVWQLVELVR